MAMRNESIPSYQKRKHRIQGVVISDRMQKTVVVVVTRIKKHPKYKKRFTVTRKYNVHDERGDCRIGDEILIEETRPFSRTKRWRVVQRIGAREITKADEIVDVPLDVVRKEDSTEVPTH